MHQACRCCKIAAFAALGPGFVTGLCVESGIGTDAIKSRSSTIFRVTAYRAPMPGTGTVVPVTAQAVRVPVPGSGTPVPVA